MIPQHIAVSTIATMLVVGLGDPKPSPLPSSHHAEPRRSRQTAASAKKAPNKIGTREFPPCCSDAPTAGPCRPRPRRPFPRWAPRYSGPTDGTAPVAISALIRRRYGTPHAVRPRRPLGPREVEESCSVTQSALWRRWEVGRNDPLAMVSGPRRGPL